MDVAPSFVVIHQSTNAPHPIFPGPSVLLLIVGLLLRIPAMGWQLSVLKGTGLLG
jgi:hypothetical protein